MSELVPLLFGPMRDHPAAGSFAREVVRVHKRYATEVVYGHRLCPFLRDIDSGFGRFCIGMTQAIDLKEARDTFVRSGSQILHMVYPLVGTEPPEFERFGSDVGKAARDWWRALPEGDQTYGPHPPVIATFHPRLQGDRTAPHRLIGLLRRAPDPFVQIIPGGHYESGTVVAPLHEIKELTPEALQKVLASVPPPPRDRAKETFERLTPALVEEIGAKCAEIRADRDRSYAPYLKEMGLA